MSAAKHKGRANRGEGVLVNWDDRKYTVDFCLKSIRAFTDHIESHMDTCRGGRAYDRFVEDIKTQDSVLRKFDGICDLAAKLIDRHPGFVDETGRHRWERLKKLRNELSHEYCDVDISAVWHTVESDVPEIRAWMDALIAARAVPGPQPPEDAPERTLDDCVTPFLDERE